jgi:hypothetical protein
MTSSTPYPAAFRCPTKADLYGVAIALLPRGRAWQTHEGGPVPGEEIGFDPGGFAANGYSATYRKPSILGQFFQAVAEHFEYLHQRLCALRLEFWCATESETNDLWLREYGLPDACDPYPDLCTKVAAIGGTNCAYYQLIAARGGWSIDCVDAVNNCGSQVGSPTAMAGRARPGRRQGAVLKIVVHLGSSSGFTGLLHQEPQAGRLKAGRQLGCGPDYSPLECLLGRVVHAEIQITYEVDDD